MPTAPTITEGPPLLVSKRSEHAQRTPKVRTPSMIIVLWNTSVPHGETIMESGSYFRVTAAAQGASKYKQPLDSLVPCGTRAQKLVLRRELESRGTCLQSDAPCTPCLMLNWQTNISTHAASILRPPWSTETKAPLHRRRQWSH